MQSVPALRQDSASNRTSGNSRKPRLSVHGRVYTVLYETFGLVRWWIARAGLRLYMLRLILRSFRGHIQILLSKDEPDVDLGLSFERDGHGNLVHCALTQARSDGIAKLEAKHPWVSFVDMQLFLEGFDLGVQWRDRTQDSDTGLPKSAGSS